MAELSLHGLADNEAKVFWIQFSSADDQTSLSGRNMSETDTDSYDFWA